MIRESIKTYSSKITDSENLRFITDNTDSLFFKSSRITVFTNHKKRLEGLFCRRVEISFMDNIYACFKDCQNCIEPSTCYKSNDKKIFKYKLKKIKGKLYLEFSNKYEKREYYIENSNRNHSGEIIEIELVRI